MALEAWLDAVADVFGTINGEGNKPLIAYHVFNGTLIPAALPGDPCAITYVPSAELEYAAGNISALTWRGTTELHVTTAPDPALLPGVMKYFGKVLIAVTTHYQLGGKVQHFFIPAEERSIQIKPLIYGAGAPHWGLIVSWVVRENVSLPLSG